MTEPSMSWSVRWIIFGIFILQLSWVFALPPFRGIDEFDHAYRAAAVANGDFVSPPSSATRGTGASMVVSRELVEAARPECQRLGYTSSADCVGQSVSDTEIEIASGAGRYHPTYYALAGVPTLWLDGTQALYAMRVWSGLLCLALLTWVLVLLRRWAGPRVALATSVATTPMVVYSTSVVAPNGMEMVAGLAFWTALAGLAHDSRLRNERAYLVLGVISGALLVGIRSLGPLWAVLILITAAVAWPSLRQRLLELIKLPRGKVALIIGASASAASLAWILSQRSLVIGKESDPEELSIRFRIVTALSEIPLWVLQSIGAFPLRNEPAPMVVYACYAIALGCLVGGGFIWGRACERLALVALVITTFLIPLGITFATLSTYGTAWQGRYTLPYLMGAALIAGLVWQRREVRHDGRLLVPTVVLVTIGQVAGPVAVLRNEFEASPFAGSSAWPAPPVWVLLLVATAGALAFVAPICRSIYRKTSA